MVGLYGRAPHAVIEQLLAPHVGVPSTLGVLDISHFQQQSSSGQAMPESSSKVTGSQLQALVDAQPA